MYGIDTYLDFLYYLLTKTKIKVDKLKCIITYKDGKDTDFIKLDLKDISRASLMESIRDIEEGRQRNVDIVDISYLDNYKYLAKFDDDTATFMIDKEQWDSSTTIKVPKMRYKDTYYAN